MPDQEDDWRALGDGAEDSSEGYIATYDISAIPNDFNVISLVSFITAKSIAIPGFQRNYVWELTRASRLIESLLLGLPVPPLFLYQKEKGPLLVIDGQQRLMSIYYFMQGRFPRMEARAQIRRLFDDNGQVPEGALQNDELFTDFKLSLKAPDGDAERRSPFHGKKYATLGEDKTSFDLRTVRNVVIKQLRPTEDHSSMFEVFNRLNSGGKNLTPQELRMSLYESDFLKLLLKLNRKPRWRQLVLREEPDVRFRDVEVLLRVFGMLVWRDNYKPSMARFLNRFAAHAEKYEPGMLAKLEAMFDEFLDATRTLSDKAFAVVGTEKFNVALFEAVFGEVLRGRSEGEVAEVKALDPARVKALDNDDGFRGALKEGTTKPDKVRTRFERAKAILTME